MWNEFTSLLIDSGQFNDFKSHPSLQEFLLSHCRPGSGLRTPSALTPHSPALGTTHVLARPSSNMCAPRSTRATRRHDPRIAPRALRLRRGRARHAVRSPRHANLATAHRHRFESSRLARRPRDLDEREDGEHGREIQNERRRHECRCRRESPAREADNFEHESSCKQPASVERLQPAPHTGVACDSGQAALRTGLERAH